MKIIWALFYIPDSIHTVCHFSRETVQKQKRRQKAGNSRACEEPDGLRAELFTLADSS